MALEQKVSLSYWYKIELPIIHLSSDLSNVILHLEEIGSKVTHFEVNSN